MSRSSSNVKLLFSSVADELSFALTRRGYATASQEVAKGGIPISKVMGKKQTITHESGVKSSWVPDPKTGYYRPEKCADEVDVAELREALLKQKLTN